MRIGNQPGYYHDLKDALGVVMILIVPVVAPVLLLLLLGRVMHSADRAMIAFARRRYQYARTHAEL